MSSKKVITQHVFNEHEVIHELKHFLPAQNPLKDFVHHNTLHAFQDKKFFQGIRRAAEIFGYNVSLSLDEYRVLYADGRIKKYILVRIITERFGNNLADGFRLFQFRSIIGQAQTSKQCL